MGQASAVEDDLAQEHRPVPGSARRQPGRARAPPSPTTSAPARPSRPSPTSRASPRPTPPRPSRLPASSWAAPRRRPTPASPPARPSRPSPPPAREVQAGSALALTISSGPKQVTVPEHRGPDPVGRQGRHHRCRADRGPGQPRRGHPPKNTVLSQDPPAGSQVERGHRRLLDVSAGPPLTTVPDVKGQSEADATATIEAAGLVVGRHRAEDQRQHPRGPGHQDRARRRHAGAGRLRRHALRQQRPQAGHRARLVGLTQSDAKAAITAAELTVGQASARRGHPPKNTVLSQDPARRQPGRGAAHRRSPTSQRRPDPSRPCPTSRASPRPTPPRPSRLPASSSATPRRRPTTPSPRAGHQDRARRRHEVAGRLPVTLYVSQRPQAGHRARTRGHAGGRGHRRARAALVSRPATGPRPTTTRCPRGHHRSEDPRPTRGRRRQPPSPTPSRRVPLSRLATLAASLDDPAVIGQLDAVAAGVAATRELEFGYDPIRRRQPARTSAPCCRAARRLIHDSRRHREPRSGPQAPRAAQSGDDLAGLLKQLYGQAPPGRLCRRHLAVRTMSTGSTRPTRPQAAREFGRSATDQSLRPGSARVDDLTEGDAALAGLALEQGDGTAAMLDWSADAVPRGSRSAGRRRHRPRRRRRPGRHAATPPAGVHPPVPRGPRLR